MTQQELALAAGMPQPSIARIERGAVQPRTATLLRMLVATGHELAVEPSSPPADRQAIRRSLALDVPMRTWRALGNAAKDPRTSPHRILRRLRVSGVPFVLLGDLAEVAHGSPSKVERVIEVCHPQTDTALERLSTGLESLGAMRSDQGRFTTPAGELRLLTETLAGDDYDLLMRNAVLMHVDTGIRVAVACLPDLIRIRKARGAPKDRAAVAVLRALRDEIDRPSENP
jgi:transcriptional regulator with XRE-family HTH domain